MNLWLAIVIIIFFALFRQLLFRFFLNILGISNVKHLVCVIHAKLECRGCFRWEHVSAVVGLLYQRELVRGMVVIMHLKFVPGKVSRIEMHLGRYPGNHVFRFAIGVCFLDVKRECFINERQYITIHDCRNLARERWFYVIKVFTPLKYAVFCHRFRLFDVWWWFVLAVHAKAVGAIFGRNVFRAAEHFQPGDDVGWWNIVAIDGIQALALAIFKGKWQNTSHLFIKVDSVNAIHFHDVKFHAEIIGGTQVLQHR